tara:strand:- start:123 stop:917 length:795 start_codon:yes stop_codon:yes gene_type:complete
VLATKEELEDLYNEIDDLEQDLVELDDTIDNNQRSIKLLYKKQNPLPALFLLSGILLLGFTIIFWPFIIIHFNLEGVLIANPGLFPEEITFILFTFSIIAIFFGLILYRLIPETKDLIKMKSQVSMNRQERVIKNRALKQMNYRAMKFQTEVEERKILTEKAIERETAKDYDSAINIWETLGEIKEAARIRTLKAEQGSVKVAQKVVQGDEVSKTEIKDSVLNRSNVGGGSSKMQELKDLTEMKKEGLIDDDEFKQMKKDILGK